MLILPGQSREIRSKRSKKSLGQNFLISKRVLQSIIKAAEIDSDDTILEVGPGLGFLTSALMDSAQVVVAVEMDMALAEDLRERFRDRSNLSVVTADARKVDIDSLVAENKSYKFVANLPYYAASPIIRRFLETRRKPRMMVVMVQLEVAQGMIAEPGKMGLLAVAIQLYGKPQIVAKVKPIAFRPIPKVTSAIVKIDVYQESALCLDSEQRFFHLVRSGFSSRRKQIHNSLRRSLDITAEATESMLERAEIEPTRRAQTLNLAEWGRLYKESRDVVWDVK